MAPVLMWGTIFDGRADTLGDPGEVLVDGNRIVDVSPSVARPASVKTAYDTDCGMLPFAPRHHRVPGHDRLATATHPDAR